MWDVKPNSLGGSAASPTCWPEASVECWSDRRHGMMVGMVSFPRILAAHCWSSIGSLVLMFLLLGFVAVILKCVCFANDLGSVQLG